MARYPVAAWKPAGTPGGPITPRIIIFHSAVVPGWRAPTPHDGLEWHFFVYADGSVDQLVDTNFRADANYHANNFAISVETADDGHPDGTPWTARQLDAMEGIARWGHATHGIVLAQTPTWDGHGLGYHTLFGAPSEWTPYIKTCPGAARKAQWPAFLARFTALPNPVPTPPPTPPSEDEMPGPMEELAAATVAVTAVYHADRTILRNVVAGSGRDPDGAGLAYWTGRMVAPGADGAKVLAELADDLDKAAAGTP